MVLELEERTLPIDKKVEQKKILRSFFLYNVGIFLYWSAYASMFNLQSSINVEGGLGTITLGISFAIAIVFALFFVPVLVRKFGAKFWMVVGDASLFPFVVANLYPTYYTLLPTAILLAVNECIMWACMSILNVLYASQYSGVSKRPLSHHTLSFSGYFFLSYQASQVFGNLISYTVLYAFDQTDIPDFSTLQNYSVQSNTSTPSTYNSTYSVQGDQYLFCGSKDCQDASVINETINQYKPVNPVSMYVLVGIVLVLELVALLIHFCFIPELSTFAQKIEGYKNITWPSKDDGDKPDMGDKVGDSFLPTGGAKLTESDKVSRPSDDDADQATVKGTTNDSLLQTDAEASLVLKNGKELHAIEKTGFIKLTKAAMLHCVEPKLLLLVPLTLYNGLAIAFAFAELTRAYASCVLGVEWVGICMAVYGVSDSIMSWVMGKYGRKLSLVATVFIALVLESGNYAYSLYWSPGAHVLPSVLAIFFMFGFTDGIFQTIVNVIHIDYFNEDQDVAINIWNVLVVAGFALGSGLSRALCVNHRIFLNFSCLILGFFGLVVADILHRRDTACKQQQESGGTSDT